MSALCPFTLLAFAPTTALGSDSPCVLAIWTNSGAEMQIKLETPPTELNLLETPPPTQLRNVTV